MRLPYVGELPAYMDRRFTSKFGVNTALINHAVSGHVRYGEIGEAYLVV